LRLGVDPFFYFEQLCRIPSIPPLIYDWQVNAIEQDTTPYIFSNDAPSLSRASRLSAVGVSTAFRPCRGQTRLISQVALLVFKLVYNFRRPDGLSLGISGLRFYGNSFSLFNPHGMWTRSCRFARAAIVASAEKWAGFIDVASERVSSGTLSAGGCRAKIDAALPNRVYRFETEQLNRFPYRYVVPQRLS